MDTADWNLELRNLSNSERLALIEAATRLIREDLAAGVANGADDDPILRVSGCLAGESLSGAEIEARLYGEEPG